MPKQVWFITRSSSGFERAINAQLADTAKPPFRCKSILLSAATSVRSAIADGNLVGGRHCDNFLVAGVIGNDVPLSLNAIVRNYAVDADPTKAPGSLCERMIGERLA